MKKVILFTFIASIFLVSCEQYTNTNNKESLAKNIDSLENYYFSNEQYQANRNNIDTMILLYSNYIENYKDDSLSIEYLFRKANMLSAIHEYEKAVVIFEEINTNYKDYIKAPNALLSEAMIYGDNLKNEVMAEKKYNEFISKYPNHPYRKDVEDLIKLLGKTDEEIMQMFSKNDTTNIN